jgi:hypothetical protein
MSQKDLIPFTKNDPRINRNGRPKTFDKLRNLALSIAERELVVFDREEVMKRVESIIGEIEKGHNEAAINSLRLVMDNARKKVSTVEAILLKMAMGKQESGWRNFLEICYGKVPDEVNITDDTAIRILVEYVNRKQTNGEFGATVPDRQS